MRRVTLVIALAVVTATMMALTVGSALAKDTNPAQRTFTESIFDDPDDPYDSYEYNAVPSFIDADGVVHEGIAQFRATVDDGDLPGVVDGTIYYTGVAGPNVTSEITHGTWILCSNFKAPPRDSATGALIDPECDTSDPSAISLTGTWKGGTAKWGEDGTYVPSRFGGQVWIGIAQVKATLGVTGGTVNSVSVKGGSGKFEGTLDHRPILSGYPPTVSGTVTLKF